MRIKLYLVHLYAYCWNQAKYTCSFDFFTQKMVEEQIMSAYSSRVTLCLAELLYFWEQVNDVRDILEKTNQPDAQICVNMFHPWASQRPVKECVMISTHLTGGAGDVKTQGTGRWSPDNFNSMYRNISCHDLPQNLWNWNEKVLNLGKNQYVLISVN